MRSWRDLLSYALILLFLILFGLLAGLTRWPDAPLYQRLGRWPLVGPWVEAARRPYLPPVSAAIEPPVPDPSPIHEAGAALGEAGERHRFVRAGLGEVILVVPGWPIYRAPDASSELLERVGRLRRRAVLEHHGGWVRVPLAGGGGSGWIDPSLPPGASPPLGEEPLPPLPLPGHPPPPERLAAARALLGEDLVEGRVGPYALYADFHDPVLETHLDLLAGGADADYRSRYGLDPLGRPAEAVILFDREDRYRQFQDTQERIAGLPSGGHASLGVVALFRGGRTRAEMGVTLMHEIGHLLNRRAVGPALPPWLDEGLADDFAFWGRRSAAYARYRRVEGHRVEMWGGLASLAMATETQRSGGLRPLEELVELDWPAFMTHSQSGLNYAHSALFVRFLEEAEAGARREPWHAYLRSVAAGGSERGEELRRRLGLSWQELDRRLAAWMLEQAASAGAVRAP